MTSRAVLKVVAVLAALTFMWASESQARFQAPGQLGALAQANLAKPRPTPPFDLTGTWQNSGAFQFTPPAGTKFTAETQKHRDAAAAARAKGEAYRDDIGHCWPAGLPVMMTRVWPIAMVQKPTVIFMIGGLMNPVRIIYLDGRPHSDPDVVVPSFNGESIGTWEGDTLVVDTKYFRNDHHWIDNGIPGTDALHIVERIKLIEQGRTLEIAYTLTDAKSWEGSYSVTKRFTRREQEDITENSCYPDLNDHMPSTQTKK
jgi:hypothetical protein